MTHFRWIVPNVMPRWKPPRGHHIKGLVMIALLQKCLSFGETWETAHPVAYDLMQLNSAEQNYPIHEKELLAIICALKKWCLDLLGSEFVVYTDHRTLEIFNTQCDLSKCQLQ